VRLVEGLPTEQTVYSAQPAVVAADFAARGAAFLHVVDLDGAFTGSPQNVAAIKAIAQAVKIPFQVGGGLRTAADVDRCLTAGAERVIIGTKAVTEPDFIARLLAEFGPERVILGLDARQGEVAIEGWTEKTRLTDELFGRIMREAGVQTVIYTDIARDGHLQGPNVADTARVARATGLKIIASGGVSSREDIQALAAEPGIIGAIIGKALYDGKISLEAALTAAEGKDS
jgi:phosphoribosylformimino-5-aminoimidazole carboxamide ribotide isomerase